MTKLYQLSTLCVGAKIYHTLRDEKEVDRLFLNYRKLMLPSVIVIAVSLLTGFGVQEKRDTVASLLTDRAFILQQAYYGEISADDAESQLRKVETQPLLKEDVTRLRTADFSELEIIEKLEVKDLQQKMTMFDNISYQGHLTWYMRGMEGNYITESDYYILLDSGSGKWKLSQFSPI